VALNIVQASTALVQGHGHAKILVWGNSGTGKSWLLATSPKPLIVLTEPNGMVSIANSNNNADVIVIQKPEDLYEFVSLAKAGKFSKYDTLGFDSLTEIQKIIKDGVLGDRGSENMTFKDWGKLADRMLGFIRTIRDLPFHIVCTALRADATDDDGGIISVGPAFEGRKTGNEIMQYFSAVAALQSEYSQEKGTVRTLHFTGNRIMMVKPCHPIDGKIINPNMSEIITAITQNKLEGNISVPESPEEVLDFKKNNGNGVPQKEEAKPAKVSRVRRRRRTSNKNKDNNKNQ